MEPEPGLNFKNISSLANLNSRTKFESTFKFLHIKLLGKKFLKKNYVLMILWVSNLRFSQIKWYETRNQTLK